MKGLAYGGVLYLPKHPAADINGLVRAIVRTKNWLWVEEILSRAGIARTHALWSLGLWSETKSAVEQMVSQQHYGKLLICPLVEAYIAPERYRPFLFPPPLSVTNAQQSSR